MAEEHDEMPAKIPDHILVQDLLRIKGENESYIEELKIRIKQLEDEDKRSPTKKTYSKDVVDGLNKGLEKKQKTIDILTEHIGEQNTRIRNFHNKLREQSELLDKYDLQKYSEWLIEHGYCDFDIIAENGIEEYLKEIE